MKNQPQPTLDRTDEKRLHEGERWIRVLLEAAIKRGDVENNGVCDRAVQFYFAAVEKACDAARGAT